MTHYRFLFFQLFQRDIQSRYKGSLLGLLWPLLQPLAQLTVFTTVFFGFMQMRWPGSFIDSASASGSQASPALHYAINLLAGLAVFNFFSEILNRAPSLIFSQPYLVTKLRFPIIILPAVCVASALIHIVIAVTVIALIQCIQGVPPRGVPLIPLWLLPITLYGFGISLLLSSLGVYLRDLVQAMPAVTSALMFITPIFYPIDLVPASMHIAFELNPLAWATESLRSILITSGDLPISEWLRHLTSSASFLALALWVFGKVKHGFADVL
jgi:lipopolysaccharide transport system permease protein